MLVDRDESKGKRQMYSSSMTDRSRAGKCTAGTARKEFLLFL